MIFFISFLIADTYFLYECVITWIQAISQFLPTSPVKMTNDPHQNSTSWQTVSSARERVGSCAFSSRYWISLENCLQTSIVHG